MSGPVNLDQERHKRRPATRKTKVFLSASTTPGLVVMDVHVHSQGMRITWTFGVHEARLLAKDLAAAIEGAVKRLPASRALQGGGRP